MGAKDYNRLFREAGHLADERAKQLGRRRLPADERAAVDEVYLRWLLEEKFDELVSALEGMFAAVGILGCRLEFVIDLASELEDRGDLERIVSLFERTIPSVWRSYLREMREANKGVFGNIAEATTRKGELLTMLYEYFEAVHRLGDLPLARQIRTQALRLANEDRFNPKMKEWRSVSRTVSRR